MHWDPKRNKWTSLTQRRRDERKEHMSLFRKKPKPEVTSAFDNIPDEIQAKLIEDVLSIVRTVRQWPTLVPENFHGPIATEVSTLLRKTGLKMASAFLTDDDIGDSFGDVLKGVELPKFFRQVWIAVSLAATEKATDPMPGHDPQCIGGSKGPCNCGYEDPNGTAA